MKLIEKILYISVFIFLSVACKNNDTALTPGNISDITAEQREGAVMLKWQVPADSSYQYVTIKYYDHWLAKDRTVVASVFADQILIENMLQKFGDYTFTLQSFSQSNTGGTPYKITTSCLRRPAEYSVSSTEQIPLTISMLSTNAQEKSEGPIANLLDNNPATYFHSSWATLIWPAYIQIDLDEAIEGLAFWYQNRANVNGKPSVIELQGSNNGVDFTLITTINTNLPSASGAEYRSTDFVLKPQSYKSFRLVVTKTVANDKFFNMANLKLYKGILSVNDPESE